MESNQSTNDAVNALRERTQRYEERITKLESTLQALKMAAAALGISGIAILGFLIYVFNAAREAEQTAQSASAVAEAAKQEADSATTALEGEKQLALDEIRKQAPLIAAEAFASLSLIEVGTLRAQVSIEKADSATTDSSTPREAAICFLTSVGSYGGATKGCNLTHQPEGWVLTANARKASSVCTATCFNITLASAV